MKVVHRLKKHVILNTMIKRKRYFVILTLRKEFVAMFRFTPKDKALVMEKAMLTAILMEEKDGLPRT